MHRRVIQRRVVVLLLLLLAGGAIVNVAVAWGFATFDNSWNSSVIGTRSDGVFLYTYTQFLTMGSEAYQSIWTIDKFGIETQSGPSPEEILPTDVRAHSRPSDLGTVDFLTVYRCGWPRLALGFERQLDDGRDDLSWGFELPFWSWRLPDGRLGSRRVVPLGLVWPGFAINTIFYAAILWVLSFVPGMVRRRIRRKRGLCPACAYPVGTSPVCTECGKQLA